LGWLQNLTLNPSKILKLYFERVSITKELICSQAWQGNLQTERQNGSRNIACQPLAFFSVAIIISSQDPGLVLGLD
jgi:hypothetical protein